MIIEVTWEGASPAVVIRFTNATVGASFNNWAQASTWIAKQVDAWQREAPLPAF